MMEFSLNSHVSSSTGTTPYELVLGRRAMMPASLGQRVEGETGAEVELAARWRLARDAMHLAQERMVAAGGTQRASFSEGDEVLLDTRNYPQLRQHKLQAPYFGPVKIKRVLQHNTVELGLPDTWTMHRISCRQH